MSDQEYKEFLLESILENKEPILEKSHWALRKSKKGESSVSKEYGQHKKRRNATGAARDQDKRKRGTKRGKQQAAARDEVRRMKEQGKIKEPKTCPKCGKSPGKTTNGLSNMIFDHTKGYGDEGHSKGQWLCRTCHNKKDNNKPGDTSKKNKRRSSGLGSISKSSGDGNISKASRAESKEKKMIRLIADNLNFLDGCK